MTAARHFKTRALCEKLDRFDKRHILRLGEKADDIAMLAA